MTELLRELEAVVGLIRIEADISSRPGQLDRLHAIADRISTHRAEIAEALADARRYRWLRDEAHKEPHTRSIGIYCEWGSNCDLGSIGGTDADVEVDAAIDAHNRAREDGE